jgi:HSP20 family protein
MARTGQWRREFTTPLFALQNELNRLFDEYVNPSRFTAGQSPPMDLEPASWVPPVDISETPEAYVVTVDVPGVEPSSIDLSVTGNVLTLRGVKPDENATEPTGALRERRFGPFHRQVVLSGDFDFEAAQAEARHGVLRVRLPKRETARPRTIPVQS